MGPDSPSMKVLKIIGITVAAFVALLLIIPLFTKKEYSVVRETIVNRTQQDVFAYIVLLKNQDNFSVWAQADKNMKKTYTGTDGKVGFVSAWDSAQDKVGAGEQEIKKIVPGERIDYQLRFLRPFKATNQAFLKAETVEAGKTKVIWGFQAKTPYPFNLMLLFFDAEKMIGQAFDDGLGNLKKILEKK